MSSGRFSPQECWRCGRRLIASRCCSSFGPVLGPSRLV
jgi:hypothetical protein